MPYIAPTQYQDRRALMANTDAQEQQTESSQLRNMLLGQENQRANALRQIYSQGRQPTVEQIGAVDPNAAMEYQNNQSLQSQRESENMMRKQSALKGIMTRFREVALQRGYDPSRPETQHILEDLRPAFTPYIESVTGQKASDDPVSWDNVVALSDMTPGELAQQKTQSEISKIQQVMPYELEQERQKQQIGNEYDIAKQQTIIPMQISREKEIEQYKADIANQRERQKAEADVYKEKSKLDQQADRDYVAATSAINEALPLLSVATQSGIGKQADAAMAYFGQSTEGADAAAALKTIGARLVGFQPKMSGPQSDRDAQLYREMSGQIGDDSLPMSRRIKALQSVKNLMDEQAKYRGSEVRSVGATGSWGEPTQIPQGAIIQVSPSTGKRRYSVDGGQSWQMVK